jgi:hypothetical protein
MDEIEGLEDNFTSKLDDKFYEVLAKSHVPAPSPNLRINVLPMVPLLLPWLQLSNH